MKKIKLNIRDNYEDDLEKDMNNPVMVLMSVRHNNSEYASVVARLAYLHDSQIRYYGDYTCSGEYIAYGFEARCYTNVHNKQPFSTFGHRLGYAEYVEVNGLKPSDMEKTAGRVSFLRKISKAIEKLGIPYDNFPVVVMCLAKVLGITTFVKITNCRTLGDNYEVIPSEQVLDLLKNAINDNVYF